MGDVLWSPRRAAALRVIYIVLILSLAFDTDAKNHGMIHADGGANHETQEKFSQIYKTGFWGEGGKGSGHGSTLTTAFIVASTIRLVMGMYSLSSLLDAPCGMMVWQEPLIAALSDDNPEFRYFGADIVPSVIQSHKETFKAYSNLQFAIKDVTKDELPQGYDLIFCREALQHLPCEMAVDALENFSKSDAKFLLTTSHNNSTRNEVIPVGEFYYINLRLAPFNLDRPARIFNEHGDKLGSPDGRYLNMYLIDYLKAQDYKIMKDGCAHLPKQQER